METATYSISIPDWRPHTLNQLMGAHWGKRTKMKSSDRSIVAHYVRVARIPAKPIRRRVEITLGFGAGERMTDVDSCQKSLLDALVKAYAIWDDSPKWCELMPVKYERGSIFTTVVLTDMDSAPAA